MKSMGLVIIILIVMILGLITYLFFIKQELARITKDISTIKKQDSNLLLHQEISSSEISALIRQINSLIKEIKQKEIQIEQKNQNLKKGMINISHDLRTPLTSALGYIDILLHSDLSKKEQEKELRIVEERLKRLEELISAFFEFSKIMCQNENIVKEPLNLIAVLEESIAHYYEDYQKENRKIHFFKCNQKIKINSKEEILIRIFDNLIGNAFKHSEGDLEITVQKKDNIRIEFKNPLQSNNLKIEKIFDKFYTVDISRTKGGTGLGLAIAKEFTERLNGTIQAEMEKGTLKIIIEFPITRI